MLVDGVDVGSTTTKAVVMKNGEVLASHITMIVKRYSAAAVSYQQVR